MGVIDALFGRSEQQNPHEQIISSLAQLDPALSGAFRAYITNRARLSVLTREAVEGYQMVKSKTKNEQTRVTEPFLREALQLIENQRRLITQMHEVSKKRRFKMMKDLEQALNSVKKTEETLRRVAAAVNDPSINRLQGMNDALTMHKSMESAVLWPTLR